MLAYSEAGLSVEKFSCETEDDVAARAFCLSSVNVEPTICFTFLLLLLYVFCCCIYI